MNNQNENFFKKNIYLSIGVAPLVILLLHKYLENFLWVLYMIPGYIILIVYILPIIGIVALLLSLVKSTKSKDLKSIFLTIFFIIILTTTILNITFKPSSVKIVNFDMSIYLDLLFNFNKR